jgi:hypothetical protein
VEIRDFTHVTRFESKRAFATLDLLTMRDVRVCSQ